MNKVLVGFNSREGLELEKLLPETEGKIKKYLNEIIAEASAALAHTNENDEEAAGADTAMLSILYMEPDEEFIAFCRMHENEYGALREILFDLESSDE